MYDEAYSVSETIKFTIVLNRDHYEKITIKCFWALNSSNKYLSETKKY